MYTYSLKEKPFWVVKRCNHGTTVPSQVYDELKPVSRSHFRRRNKWILIKCFYLRTQRMKIVLFGTYARNYCLPVFRKFASLVNAVTSHGYSNIAQWFYSDVYLHYKTYIYGCCSKQLVVLYAMFILCFHSFVNYRNNPVVRNHSRGVVWPSEI